MTESDQTRDSDQDCCEISYIITSGRFGTPAEGLLRQDETHVEFIGVVIDPEVMEGVYEYALEAAMRTLDRALREGPDLGPVPGAEPSTVDEDENYMPSTAEVRAKFAACAGEFIDLAEEQFDRWVAEVKAEARREGLARGFDEGWVARADRARFNRPPSAPPPGPGLNPYRGRKD